MSDVETSITPPDADEDEGGDSQSWRLGIHYIGVDEVSYDAAVQRFTPDQPHEFADAMLNAALALAQMRGSDFALAVMQKFAAYDGMNR